MLAEIFMVRLEAAARLQQETALGEQQPVHPFHPEQPVLIQRQGSSS